MWPGFRDRGLTWGPKVSRRASPKPGESILSHVFKAPIPSLTHSCAMCWEPGGCSRPSPFWRCDRAIRQGRCHSVEPGFPDEDWGAQRVVRQG